MQSGYPRNQPEEVPDVYGWRSELVGDQEWQQMKIEYYVEFGERSSHTGREVVWYTEV